MQEIINRYKIIKEKLEDYGYDNSINLEIGLIAMLDWIDEYGVPPFRNKFSPLVESLLREVLEFQKIESENEAKSNV